MGAVTKKKKRYVGTAGIERAVGKGKYGLLLFLITVILCKPDSHYNPDRQYNLHYKCFYKHIVHNKN